MLDRLRAAGVTVSRRATAPRTFPTTPTRSCTRPRCRSTIRNWSRRDCSRRARCPVLHRAGALAAIAAMHRTIAVAGSHGKTTTSSMLALILRAAGWQPSFLIGGELNEVGTNAAYGDGELARRRSRRERRHVPAHRARRRDRDERRARPPRPLRRASTPLVDAFERFVDSVPGPVVVGVRRRRVARGSPRARPGVRTYGEDARRRLPRRRTTAVTLPAAASRSSRDGATLGDLVVPIGVKAATNATGAAAMALELGVPFADDRARAARASAASPAASSSAGERDGVTFVDDYAHLPG